MKIERTPLEIWAMATIDGVRFERLDAQTFADAHVRTVDGSPLPEYVSTALAAEPYCMRFAIFFLQDQEPDPGLARNLVALLGTPAVRFFLERVRPVKFDVKKVRGATARRTEGN